MTQFARADFYVFLHCMSKNICIYFLICHRSQQCRSLYLWWVALCPSHLETSLPPLIMSCLFFWLKRAEKPRKRNDASTTPADSSSLFKPPSNTHMGVFKRVGIARKWWNKWISTLPISLHYPQVSFHNQQVTCGLRVDEGMCVLTELGHTNWVWTAREPERFGRLCARAEIWEPWLNKEGLIKGARALLRGLVSRAWQAGTTVMR